MPHNHFPRFRKNLLALAIGTALAPHGAWALDLVESPPLPKAQSSFIPPNVIISVDDSGSMGFAVSGSDSTQRMKVLKDSLTAVFSDTELIPDKGMRLAWQAMHNNGNSPNAASVNSGSLNQNSMRRMDAYNNSSGKTHRQTFLDFVNNLSPNGGTPTHKMSSQADAYMRRTKSINGPWATKPGGTAAENTEYLGCRRNYHILMTDGRWNGAISGGAQDNVAWAASGDRQAYSLTSDQTRVYRDADSDTLADWAFKSWMDPLQTSGLVHTDKLKPSKAYDEAPATENFTAIKLNIVTVTGNTNNARKTACQNIGGEYLGGTANNCKLPSETKSLDLQKYWNPKYNPATWPHMVTYTIGFSNDAVTWPNAPEIIKPSIKAADTVDGGGYLGWDKGFADLVTGVQTWPTMDGSNTTNNGSFNEGKRALDLWHAAINGRGRFYPVTVAEDLAKAFREIIGKINEESASLPDQISAGGGSSGSSIQSTNVGLFGVVYNPKAGWSGAITASPAREAEEFPCPTPADPTAKCLKFEDPTSAWGGKNTAQLLDEMAPSGNTGGNPTGRKIVSWSDKWAGSAPTGGVPFVWSTTDSNLSTPQKALLGKESDDATATVATKGENILNYIRGDRSKEGDTATAPFRVRTTRQGDIVNSEIWYTGAPSSNYAVAGYGTFASTNKNREPMLYVGGNDGMLHGFSAKNGTEKIAYVPRGVISKLKNLTDPEYQTAGNHKYYVDGSPMTGDIKDNTTWKTMLVGTLGAGGKGYFVLDVTDPSAFSANASGATALAQLDRTRGNTELVTCPATAGAERTACLDAVAEDRDIGNIIAKPVRNPNNQQESTQITRMNNGRWAVVMGNGYNSSNQRPVLLVQYLDGDKELVRIQAVPSTVATGVGNANDNGLAAPALVDLNGDGKTDVVYAGDNLGNLWKFDLTSDTDSEWKVAFSTGSMPSNTPLFTARGPATLNAATRGEVQPISAPPIVRANDRTACTAATSTGCSASATSYSVGGLMVAFGTGRNVTEEDRNANPSVVPKVQTLYSVLDNARYRTKTGKTHLEIHPGAGDCSANPATCVPIPAAVGTISNSGAPLAKQTIAAMTVAGATGSFGTVNATDDLKKSTWKDFKGWYLDLPESGERLLKPMQFYDGSNILAVYTESPSGTQSSSNTSANINESCTPSVIQTTAGTQYRTLINIMDGKKPTVPLILINGSAITNLVRVSTPPGTPTLIKTPRRILDYTGASGGGSGGGGNGTPPPPTIEGLRMPEQSLRPGWRQFK